MAMDDHLSGLVSALGVNVLLRVHIVLNQLREEADVADGQPQRVHLAQALLVRQRGDVRPQAFERFVDGLHSFSFALVRRLPLLHLLLRAAFSALSRLAHILAVVVVATDVRRVASHAARVHIVPGAVVVEVLPAVQV